MQKADVGFNPGSRSQYQELKTANKSGTRGPPHTELKSLCLPEGFRIPNRLIRLEIEETVRCLTACQDHDVERHWARLHGSIEKEGL